MGINLGSARARASELNGCAGRLRTAQRRLEEYKRIFDSSWQGPETAYYIQAVGNIERKINQVSAELEAIGGTIVAIANQIHAEEEAERIRREEEERARLEAEERARQEAEAAAREQ